MSGMTESFIEHPVYLETDVFIKAVEGTAETAAAPKKLIAFLRTRPAMATTSEIAIAETLAPPRRPDALSLHIKRRVYLDLLLRNGLISLISVTRDLLIETALFAGGNKNETARCNSSCISYSC